MGCSLGVHRKEYVWSSHIEIGKPAKWMADRFDLIGEHLCVLEIATLTSLAKANERKSVVRITRRFCHSL
jgi:hypothetical protein